MTQALWLRSIASIGLLVFGAVVFAVAVQPAAVERLTTAFIEQQAAEDVESRIAQWEISTGNGSIRALAKSLRIQNLEEQQRLRKALADRVEQQWARAIAEVRDLSCACRQRIADLLRTGMTDRLTLLSSSAAQLDDFIQGQYLRVRSELLRDIAIFSICNGFVFLVLLIASFLKPGAVLQLFVPGLLLALSSVVCAALYLFEQNWMLTIIFGDYLGASYLFYLGGVFALLCDVILNRARVTTEIFNGVAQAIGSTLSAVPC